MGLPVLTRLSRIKYIEGDSACSRYSEQGWKMYSWTRDSLAGGLFNTIEGLWWRDKDFVPPYKEPNGMNCYWSRGNGWVYAALVRAMDNAMIAKHSGPPSHMEPRGEYKWIVQDYENHFEDYRKDFCKMSYALARCQRKDHFWNVSLLDESNYGGKELTGTALFVYGMAWGVRHGILPKKMFLPIISRTWKAMYKHCVHSYGFLGFVQGTGKEPKDSQPVGYDTEPDFDDFGLGCFLLASAEVYRLGD
jgi:rhamnogalacturonyl hydrolase YesR